jgi:uncharacterized protein YbaP (TraB family)
MPKSLPWRVFLVTVAAFMALLTVTAQGDETSETPQQEVFPEHTSLWKVETDSSVVYLMGSIHLLKKEDFPLHPKMEDAFARAQTLVFEIELDSAQTPGFQQTVFFKALYDSGKTLQGELGDSLYGRLGSELAPLGLDINQMNQFEPWMVTVTFVALKLQELGLDPAYGVDAYFYGKAKAEDKHILALETPQEQIDFFDTMPPADQRNLIGQTLEQSADIEDMLDEIVMHWKTGDLEGLEATINKSFGDFLGIRQRLLTDRNRTWMKNLEAYLKDKGEYLVIVGVGHMSGEDGLIELLRKAGYTPRQL